MVRHLIIEGKVAALGVVVGHVVANFKLGFGQVREAAAVEQFDLEAALKRVGVGIVVTAAASARLMLGIALYRLLWPECTISPAGWLRTVKARRKSFLMRFSGIVSGTSQPTTLREQQSSHITS